MTTEHELIEAPTPEQHVTPTVEELQLEPFSYQAELTDLLADYVETHEELEDYGGPRPYERYWSQYLPVEVANGSPAQRKRQLKAAKAQGKFFAKMGITEDFQQRAEATGRNLARRAQDMREALNTPGQDHSQTVEEWYCRAGPMNEMEGAEPDLLRAAILLERAQQAQEKRGEVVGSHKRLLLADVYLDLLVRNGRGVHALYGNTDLGASNLFANKALEHISAVQQQEKGWTHHLYEATQKYYDIHFELIWQRWPQVPAPHNTADPELQGMRSEYRRVLLQNTADTLQMAEQWFSDYKALLQAKHQAVSAHAKGEASKQLHGTVANMESVLLEAFSRVAHRYVHLRDGNQGRTAIRGSTRREQQVLFDKVDDSGDGNIRKQSVDVLVDWYDEGEFYREHYQLKSGEGEEAYLPPIIMFTGIRSLVTEIGEVSRSKARAFKGNESLQYISTVANALEWIANDLQEGSHSNYDESLEELLQRLTERLQPAA